jgi:CHAT domain-containing protein
VNQVRTILLRLYNLLLGDLVLPADCKNLIIVPHGFLHYLPFQALLNGDEYLIERYAISYAPSATLFGVCHARASGRRKRRGALVLAHSSDGSLPHTLGEGNAVGRVLGASVYEEAEATRGVIERYGQRAGVIHIAAHGHFRQDAPLFSAVELADGPLTSADVFNLDLSGSLVTLSACETGRSVIGGGDELVGMTRAFLYAGAAGLLVSQWRVDDAATARLMTDFYRAWRNTRGVLAGPKALQFSQIASLREYAMPQNMLRHPFYWAGFQIIGSG